MQNHTNPWVVKSKEIWGRFVPCKSSFDEILKELKLEERTKFIAHSNKVVLTMLGEDFHPSQYLEGSVDSNDKKILELRLEMVKITGRQAEILGLDYSVLFMQNRAVARWYLLVIGNFDGSGMQGIRKKISPDDLDLDSFAERPKLNKYPEYALAQKFLSEHREKVQLISKNNCEMQDLEAKKNKLTRRLASCLEKRKNETYLFHCEYCGRLSESKQGRKNVRCGRPECNTTKDTIDKKTIGN